MSTPVEKIKERLTITEVVESYIKLDQAGSNLKGKCPFHNEKTPSFFVSPDRGSYYCFGCGAKGDIFSFVQAFEGLDFMGALKLLALRAGVELKPENPIVKSERERLYAVMEEATKLYEHMLWKDEKALQYLRGRGLTDETIKEFRLGLAPLEWRTMYMHLKNMRYSEQEMEKVGLIKRAEMTKSGQPGYYDRFRGRIMFPISDGGGRVIAFTGRILEDDGKSAKYLNSPDTTLFDKSSVLYGIDKAKIEIRKKNFTILVEGQMDLIMSHQAGFKNTVAGSGTALTDSLFKTRAEKETKSTLSDEEVQMYGASVDNIHKEKAKIVNNLGVVKRISPNIIMVYDSDKAGMNAAARSAQIALGLGMDVKIGELPAGLDPADLILKDKEEWKNVLKNAKHIVEFQLNVVLHQGIDPRKLPKALIEKVLPFVASIESHMEKSHFISKIKDRTGLSEDAIISDLRVVEKMLKENIPRSATQQVQPVASAHPKVAAEVHRRDVTIKKILGIVYWQEILPLGAGKQDKNSEASKNASDSPLEDEKPVRKIDIAEVMKKIEDTVGIEKVATLKKETDPQKNELIFEAEVVYGKASHLKDDIDEMLLNYKTDLLKEQLTTNMKELSLAERSKDEARATEILKKCQELSIQISSLTKRK